MKRKLRSLVCLLCFVLQVSSQAVNYVRTTALNGFPDGMFRRDSRISRAQFAKMMTVAAGFSPQYNAQRSYSLSYERGEF